MKRTIAAAVLGTLLLSGCTQQTDVLEPTVEESAKVNPQTQALEQAAQAGLLRDESETGLSEREARGQVAGVLDESEYAVELTDETLTVGEDDAARDYYVFEVIDVAESRAVGKVAVDCETGEKYYYLGDGVLEDYSTFPLYDEAAERSEGWPGRYVSPAGVTLEITQAEGEEGFSFRFSDGTAGTAAASGDTAKSADETLNFLLAGRIVTVAGGGLTGNYTVVLGGTDAETAQDAAQTAEAAPDTAA